MNKNRLLTILVFLTITFTASYLWDNMYLSIVIASLIFIDVYFIYISNQDFKIVIHKRHLQSKKYANKLSNYYVLFLELSNLNIYSQFYDIGISDQILKSVYGLLKKQIPANQLFLYRTDQIVIIQEFKNTHIINSNLQYDEQYRSASRLYSFLKSQKFIVNDNDNYTIDIHIGVGSQGVQKIENSLNDVVRLAHFSMIKAQEKKFKIEVANEELRNIKQDLDSFNQEIHKGFKLDEFSPFFLPIIDVKTLKIVGCEALVRWRKNKYRVIEASKFKHIAIEKQLFEKIDKRIIEKTFASYQSWYENGFVDEGFIITINLSYNSLINLNISELIKLNKEYNINAKNVEFDISDDGVTTEEGIMAITRLKDYGFHVSLDTFSERRFSFQALLDMDIDTVKIDKSNLPNSEISDKQFKFYESIVNFSKSLNLKILSKGIENKHHLEIVKQLNVDYVQGYYFTPPLDEINILVFLRKYKDGILTP